MNFASLELGAIFIFADADTENISPLVKTSGVTIFSGPRNDETSRFKDEVLRVRYDPVYAKWEIAEDL